MSIESWHTPFSSPSSSHACPDGESGLPAVTKFHEPRPRRASTSAMIRCVHTTRPEILTSRFATVRLPSPTSLHAHHGLQLARARGRRSLGSPRSFTQVVIVHLSFPPRLRLNRSMALRKVRNNHNRCRSVLLDDCLSAHTELLTIHSARASNSSNVTTSGS